MTIENKEVYARGRIATIEAHSKPLMREMVLHKGRVAMRGALGVGLGVLTIGLSRAGVDVLAVISAGSTIGAVTSSATHHMRYVRPRDQTISGYMREAEAIATEAGIEFKTDYVHPEHRPIGKRIAKLLGKTTLAQQA